MKVRTIKGNSVDLSPLQIKLALYCSSHKAISECMECKYDRTCTLGYFNLLGDTPNGAIMPKNFNACIHTNNYRKQHNLPKKRKGVDYFD